MPGPLPLYQPTFTVEQIAACERVVRQHTAPQARVYRAKLALLLQSQPMLDNPTAARQLGKHENWVRYWRRIWTKEGFRLADKPGRGRKPAFPPVGRGHRQGAGLRIARPAG
jgi:hypothetical protein